MWSRWNAMDESAAGLVLIAADVQQGLGCGDTAFSTSALPMAQLLASNDGILNRTRVDLNAVFNSNATFDMDIYGANHQSFGDYDSSQRFELLGQVDGDVLFPDSIAWDLAAAAIAHVAARTGVPMPSLIADPTSNSAADDVQTTDKCPPVDVDTNSGTESSGAVVLGTGLLSGMLTLAVAWN